MPPDESGRRGVVEATRRAEHDRAAGSGGARPRRTPAAQARPRAAVSSGAAAEPGAADPALVPTSSRHHTSLRRPTVKVAVALALVSAIAAGAGSLLGLPLPVVGDDGGGVGATQAGVASLASAGISPGTPVGLMKGPYHPVVIESPDYGEGPARFGADRGGRRHEGQDVFARPGTPLVAVRDGTVVDGGGGRSFYSLGGGNTLVIYSPSDDRSYVYLHMLKPALVNQGDRVQAGQLVGQIGCTGSCDGPHLHFEVRRGRAVFGPQRKAFDPLPLLEDWPVRPTD